MLRSSQNPLRFSTSMKVVILPQKESGSGKKVTGASEKVTESDQNGKEVIELLLPHSFSGILRLLTRLS